MQFFILNFCLISLLIIGKTDQAKTPECENSTTTTSNRKGEGVSTCLIFDTLRFSLANSQVAFRLPINPRVFFIQRTGQILLFRDCARTQPCLIEPFLLSFSSDSHNISSLIMAQKLNHTLLSDIDREPGLFSQGDFEAYFKLISGVNGRAELYRLDLRFTQNGTFKDFKWVAMQSRSCPLRPVFREEASLVKIHINSRECLLLTGGISDSAFSSDVWLFDLKSGCWAESTGVFPRIKGHSVNFLDNPDSFSARILVFGGNSDGRTTNELYIGELQVQNQGFSINLKAVEGIGLRPSPREGHVGVGSRGKVIYFGGCDFERQNCSSEVWELEFGEDDLAEWSLLSPRNLSLIPPPRENPAFLFLPATNSLLLFGGCDSRFFCDRQAFLLQLYRQCFSECPRNSRFLSGKCRCNPGFKGPDCEEKAGKCKEDCNARGECNENGTCLCERGFFGETCEFEFCRDGCNGRGFCDEGTMTCQCERDYFGPNCKGNCIKNCNGNGYCYNGNCVCFPGFNGPSCLARAGFSGCWTFTDFLETGQIRKACFTTLLDGSLSGFLRFNGRALLFRQTRILSKENPLQVLNSTDSSLFYSELIIEGKLYSLIPDTSPEEAGYLFEKAALITLENNEKRRVLVMELLGSRIEVFRGEYQRECEAKRDCFGNGYCDSEGKCQCGKGFFGSVCQFRESLQVFESKCRGKCGVNGACNEASGGCACFHGYNGSYCEITLCPGNCSGNGFCDASLGKCVCRRGFQGTGCELKVACGNDCSGNGICEVNEDNEAVCRCFRGFFGKDCGGSCRRNCSERGKCDPATGKCLCEGRFQGSFCEEFAPCPLNCSDRGSCFEGQCQCEFGYSGEICEFEVVCPKKCSGKGQCIWGKCLCDHGFSGIGCEFGFEIQNEREIKEEFRNKTEDFANKTEDFSNKNGTFLGKPTNKSEVEPSNINQTFSGNFSDNLSNKSEVLMGNLSINQSEILSNFSFRSNDGLLGKLGGNNYYWSDREDLPEKRFSFRDVESPDPERFEKPEGSPGKGGDLTLLVVSFVLGLTIIFILNNLKRTQ